MLNRCHQSMSGHAGHELLAVAVPIPRPSSVSPVGWQLSLSAETASHLLSLKVLCPRLHQHPPLLEQVAPRVTSMSGRSWFAACGMLRPLPTTISRTRVAPPGPSARNATMQPCAILPTHTLSKQWKTWNTSLQTRCRLVILASHDGWLHGQDIPDDATTL